MPITIYPGSMKKRNANGSYSDLVPAIATDPEVLDDFAEEYSTSETYNIGDYCIHNSDLYKCNTNNTTGTWNNNAWDRVSVAYELVDHKNTLTKVIPILPGSTNNLGYTLNVGDYFESGGVLYKVTTAIPNTEAWAGKASSLTATVVNDLKDSMPKLVTFTSVPYSYYTNGFYSIEASDIPGVSDLRDYVWNLQSTDTDRYAPILRAISATGITFWLISIGTNSISVISSGSVSGTMTITGMKK